MLFRVLFLFSLYFALISPARAADVFSFDNQISPSSRQSLNHFLKDAPSSDFDIARADLNDDGLNEFILRDKTCNAENKFCRYRILAETDGKMTLLGEIEARNIVLGNSASQGVRNILAFQNTVNEYQETVYVWEPVEGRYMISE